jgi:hypothetical protein
VSGNWRSLLTEDSTDDPFLSYQSSGEFTVAIEMIGPYGTDRYTHALTHFVVTDRTQKSENNSTIVNFTSVINLLESCS